MRRPTVLRLPTAILCLLLAGCGAGPRVGAENFSGAVAAAASAAEFEHRGPPGARNERDRILQAAGRILSESYHQIADSGEASGTVRAEFPRRDASGRLRETTTVEVEEGRGDVFRVKVAVFGENSTENHPVTHKPVWSPSRENGAQAEFIARRIRESIALAFPVRTE